MQVRYLKKLREKRQFMRFRTELYKNDLNAFCTSEFVAEDLVFANTDFARECDISPVWVEEDGAIVAEAILVYNKKLPFVQVGLFEALPGKRDAALAIVDEAKKLAKSVGVKDVVIGLNGHISYGVGILSEGFEYKNSFDSLYNKPYYKDYFSHLKRQTISTYKREKAEMEQYLAGDVGGYRVRQANLKDFYKEAELMRALCEKTIAKTFLYFPTEEGHFYQLMRDLRPFLKNENLLFAENERGEAVGFLFWHPDFNMMLKGGRGYSTLGLGLAYFTGASKITTAKLNAMGALSVRATSALLSAFSEVLGQRFLHVETNFVWDNNIPSTLINERFFGKPHRKYEVYFDEVD